VDNTDETLSMFLH